MGSAEEPSHHFLLYSCQHAFKYLFCFSFSFPLPRIAVIYPVVSSSIFLQSLCICFFIYFLLALQGDCYHLLYSSIFALYKFYGFIFPPTFFLSTETLPIYLLLLSSHLVCKFFYLCFEFLLPGIDCKFFYLCFQLLLHRIDCFLSF